VHFMFDSLGRNGEADCNCFALSNFVLENSQGFVERVDQEVRSAVAYRLFPGGGIRSCGQRCGAGNVARHQQRSAVGDEFPDLEQPSAQAQLLIRTLR
jgi:hypothetical protein